MKINFILLLTCLSLNYTAFSQSDGGKTSFGLRAGINFQNLNGKDASGSTLKNNLVLRYHAGVNLEIPVAPDFYFQPNLLFITKGASVKSSVLGQNYTSTVNLYYIEVPLNFLYKPLLGTGHLLLGFGPYVAYGIGGKFNLNGTSESIKFKNTVPATDDGPVFKPFDAGANLLFGYEFASKISLQLNAQLGLLNLSPSYDGIDNDNSTLKNTGFGISVGYRF